MKVSFRPIIIAFLLTVGISLVIVVALNFFLLLPTPFKCEIIRHNTTEGMWLSFWGTFLAAIGSFVMAYVAYIQNKKVLAMSQTVFECESKKKDFERRQLFIEECCHFHNQMYFDEIIRLYRREKYDEAIYKTRLYWNDLYTCKIKLIEYQEKDDSYMKRLEEINTLYLEVCDILLCIVEVNQSLLNTSIPNKFKEFCKGSTNYIENFVRYKESRFEEMEFIQETFIKEGINWLSAYKPTTM